MTEPVYFPGGSAEFWCGWAHQYLKDLQAANRGLERLRRRLDRAQAEINRLRAPDEWYPFEPIEPIAPEDLEAWNKILDHERVRPPFYAEPLVDEGTELEAGNCASEDHKC